MNPALIERIAQRVNHVAWDERLMNAQKIIESRAG